MLFGNNDSSADFSKAERDALEKSISFISMGIHEGVMSGHVDQVSNGTTDWRIEYVEIGGLNMLAVKTRLFLVRLGMCQTSLRKCIRRLKLIP